MKKVEISTGYTPRPIQADIHRRMKRFNVIVAHRRMGKTTMCVNETIDRGLRNPLKHPRYAYIAPFRDQAKKVAWDHNFKEFTKNLPGRSVNEAELRVDIERPQGDVIRFQLFGAENPDAMRGLYFDGVILDEFGVMESSIWGEVVRPALLDRNGWAIFIGTPKGKNKFYDLYQFSRREMRRPESEWFGALYKASETGIIPPKELESLRRELSKADYEQELECNFQAANKGAYYAHLLEIAEATGKVTRVPHQPGHPVYTAWDLGVSDAMSIWFWQMVGKEIHVIDYFEDEEGKGMLGALEALGEDERRHYLYHTHFVPHDGSAKELSGRTRVQDLMDYNRGRVHILERYGVQDGIHEVKKTIPKCYFDEDRTELGRDRLKTYQRKWDRKREIFLADPQHDESSHGADAFRSMAMGLRHVLNALPDEEEILSVIDYDPFDMEAI